MHPAYSVIVFTCASGAGYGLLSWLALSVLRGGPDQRPFGFGIATFAVAFVLITIGLLASTAHLGRPERAWRAFSQWRTSWLSREGVMAIVTYAVGGLFALAWLFADPEWAWTLLPLGASTIVCCLSTLWCTGMIYGSLTTIRAWNNGLVAPLYIALGLVTGRLLLNTAIALTGAGLSVRAIWLTLIILLATWILKAVYWYSIDNTKRSHTIGEATGLGRFGRVRTLDPPHTSANYVMREMGYQVARKHADKLRLFATVLLFVVPVVLTLVMLIAGREINALAAIASVFSAAAGVAVERWLFFAEAEHVSMLYYGREAA